MLEMIVLGQIPGTHFQITFSWFVAMAFLGLFFVDYRSQHPSRHTKSSHQRQAE